MPGGTIQKGPDFYPQGGIPWYHEFPYLLEEVFYLYELLQPIYPELEAPGYLKNELARQTRG